MQQKNKNVISFWYWSKTTADMYIHVYDFKLNKYEGLIGLSPLTLELIHWHVHVCD